MVAIAARAVRLIENKNESTIVVAKYFEAMPEVSEGRIERRMPDVGRRKANRHREPFGDRLTSSSAAGFVVPDDRILFQSSAVACLARMRSMIDCCRVFQSRKLTLKDGSFLIYPLPI